MTRYIVNATMTVAAWVEVAADSADDAEAEAAALPASAFEYDLGSAEVEFNVTPAVEVA